jgi:hypothetical protein
MILVGGREPKEVNVIARYCGQVALTLMEAPS